MADRFIHPYNAGLPYVVPGAEAAGRLDRILRTLAPPPPGAAFDCPALGRACTQLGVYLELKQPLPRADRAAICRELHALGCHPNLPLSTQARAARRPSAGARARARPRAGVSRAPARRRPEHLHPPFPRGFARASDRR